MRVPLSDTLRRLDRHWLLNHPILWIMRLHWVVYSWLLGLVLICLVALVLPVSFQTVESLNTYFWAVLALAGLAVSPWIYLQARFAPQLRQSSQARTAVYLLAAYLFILGIPLAWPYAFVAILEAKISRGISEDELRKDLQAVIWVYKDRNESLNSLPRTRLLNKYERPNRGIFDPFNTFITIRILCRIKGVDLNNGSDTFFDVEPRNYRDSGVVLVIEVIVFLLALLLRVFQSTDVKSLLITLLYGIAIWIALVVLLPATLLGPAIYSTSLLLFSVGGYAVFRAPQLRRKSVLSLAGMNSFVLFLAWVPFLLRGLIHLAGYTFLWENSVRGPRFVTTRFVTTYFLLGVVLLFALTPWIQRRYLALQAKPS